MSWLVVTPARNEADRIPLLAESLRRQTSCPVGLWVIVDDGSTDGTADVLPTDLSFPVHVVRRDNCGGLSRGSEFGAFLFGAEEGLRLLPDAQRVMKLDADIVLADDYFAELLDSAGSAALVAGWVDEPGERTRPDYTRGPLKAYDREAFELIRTIPVDLGWDVMDEVVIRMSGRTTAVVPTALATVTRRTGSSEGLLAGRHRAGVVARWTGFHPLYFLARVLRYTRRRPPVIGVGALLVGWATAGRGPYPVEMRRAHRAEQWARIRQATRRHRRNRGRLTPYVS